MTKEELAARLNGRNVGVEMSYNEEMRAADSGLVVCFGYADCIIDFRGCIGYTLNEQGGAMLCFVEERIIIHDLDYSPGGKFIKAIFNENKWLFESNVPHATFDIMADDELFCKGIVFDYKDIQ